MSQENIPKHIAIIMDGNGRWAKQKFKPRVFGHRAGTKAVFSTIKYCVHHKIEALTLFAFSTENWSRPQEEVNLLLKLFVKVINDEINDLNDNNVRLKVIGDISKFPTDLQQTISSAELFTKNNTGLKLNVAANYGGRWDIIQAVNKILAGPIDKSKPAIDEETFCKYLCLAKLPEPDLFIRTGGETRISNFFLWQLAYTELYFTKIHWPDFDEAQMQKAVDYFKNRDRRFGAISEQM